MKMKSRMFVKTKRSTQGRKLVKHLDDARVAIAKEKSKDLKHQMKFMSPGKRFATALALAS